MTKKWLTLLLAALMLLTMVACGSKQAGSDDADWVGFEFKNKNSVELGDPAKELNPQSVYDGLTYTAPMFYGHYQLKGGEEAEDAFAEDISYTTVTLGGEEAQLSVLPFEITAGKHSMSHVITYVQEYEWMQLYLKKKVGDSVYLDSVFCAYTIEGNTLKLKPLDTYEYDKEQKKISYSFADFEWTYEFAFKGRKLTMKNGDDSVTLDGALASGDVDFACVDAYISDEGPMIDNLLSFDFYYSSDNDHVRFYVETADDETSYTGCGLMEENGLFTFTVPLESGTKTYQFVYFYAYNDGLVLTDGTHTYYYNDDWSDRCTDELNKYLSEDMTGKLDDLTESELEALVEKKENLMDDLVDAFEDAGISVSVNDKTGELAMDASVLFGGDSAELTADGKAFLNKFVAAYSAIVFSDKYEGFVAKTMVEGHAAPVAGDTYESALPFSKKRADNVRAYCLSLDSDLSTASLEAVGYSNSKPIKDANGKVDMAASRRVSFRFIINLGE